MKSTSRTISSVKNEIYNLVGDEYTLLSNSYKNNSIKLKFKHSNCGFEFEMSLRNFLNGQRCPECAKKKRIDSATRNRKTIESIKNELYKLTGDEYIFLSTNYTNNKEKVKFKHNICGHEFEMKLNNFLNGQRCPKCAREEDKKRLLENYQKGISAIKTKYAKKQDTFKKEIFKLVKDEYSLKSEYHNCKEKVLFTHNICNNDFLMTPNHFLDGRRCPFCNESKGEKLISNILTEGNINFTSQKTFENCKNINLLKFDFFINEKILVEYDGEFHFKDIFKDGSLKLTKQRDSIKNKYCRENKIPLLRIPFWEFDRIPEIMNSLNEFIKDDFSYTSFEKWRRSLKIKSFTSYKNKKK